MTDLQQMLDEKVSFSNFFAIIWVLPNFAVPKAA
jgi:hypothetical protein